MELTVIPGEFDKWTPTAGHWCELGFQSEVANAVEAMDERCEHNLTKTGRQRWASNAKICEWIGDAWANVC